MNLLAKFLIVVVAALSLSAPLVPAVAGAQASKADVCEGLSTTTGNACDNRGNNNTVQSTMRLVLNMFSFVVGFAAVIMIIIGGFRYVISAGDGANTAGAKNTILYAIIGLVIVALAQFIVRFVITRTV